MTGAAQPPQGADPKLPVPADIQAPKTAGAALVNQLFSAWAQTWNKPLPEPLPWASRFRYAFAGAVPWVFVNFGSEWLSTLQAFGPESSVVLIGTGVVLQLVLGGWFAWLISYQERPCSPSRFFLEGLLFPGIAAALLTSAYLGG